MRAHVSINESRTRLRFRGHKWWWFIHTRNCNRSSLWRHRHTPLWRYNYQHSTRVKIMAVNIYEMTDTWNDAGTEFDGIKMDVTNTASATHSRLLTLAVDGTRRAVIHSNGALTLGSANSNTGFVPATADGKTVDWKRDSTNYMRLGTNVAINTTNGLGLGPTVGSPTTKIISPSSGILEQRPFTGSDPQEYRLYDDYTDGSNNRYLSVSASETVDTIQSVRNGTGGSANVDLALAPIGTGRVRFGTHTSIGAETLSGYVTIKDSGGTERKVAVVS